MSHSYLSSSCGVQSRSHCEPFLVSPRSLAALRCQHRSSQTPIRDEQEQQRVLLGCPSHTEALSRVVSWKRPTLFCRSVRALSPNFNLEAVPWPRLPSDGQLRELHLWQAHRDPLFLERGVLERKKSRIFCRAVVFTLSLPGLWSVDLPFGELHAQIQPGRKQS